VVVPLDVLVDVDAVEVIGLCSVLLGQRDLVLVDDAEPADEIDRRHIQPEVREVGVVLPALRALVTSQVQIPNFGRIRFGGGAEECHARRAERIPGNIGLRNQQAGSRVLLQILRVHGHAADEKHGAAPRVDGIRHHGSEWNAGVLPGVCGKAAGAAQRCQGPGAFGESRLRYFRTGGPGSGVLSGRHSSILADRCETNLRLRYH